MTASALLRPLFRRFAPMALLLTLLASCTDGGTPLSPVNGDGTVRLLLQPSLSSAVTCTAGDPISRIRLRAITDPGGDIVHTEMFDVPPTAANWTLTLDVPVTAGVTRIVVQMELISTTSGTDVVQCSGVTAPIVLDLERPTQAAPLVLFDGPADNLRATAVTITTAVPALSEGDSVRLAATVTGPGSPQVFWRSLDTDVATVRADGTVRLLRSGSARIVAEVGILADTVVISAAQRAASLRITQASLTAASLGDEPVFTAEVLDPRGAVIPGAAVTWSIDNATIAQSLGGGRFRALANGTATVRAVAAANASAAATASLIVRQEPVTITVTPASFIFTAVGLSSTFTAQARDARGNPVLDAVVTWSSSADGVVAITAAGVATARSAGAANLTARSGSAEGHAEVRVAQAAARLTLTPASARLESIGEETTVTVRAFDSNDNEIASPTAELTSSDPAVATVDASGRVRAVGNGTATIRAALDGASATMTVTVQQRAVTVRLAETELHANRIGQELTFVATALDARGVAVPAAPLVWESAQPEIAESQDNGVFVTTGAGTTSISVAVAGTEVRAFGSIVVEQVPAIVAVTPASFAFGGIGATAVFEADVRDAGGTSIPGMTVVWSSSAPAVVEIGQDGVATSRGQGSAVITARTGTGLTGTASVTVQRTVARLVITPAELALARLGATADLTLSAVDGAGDPIATPAHVWSSSDPAVATVDANGRVTAVGAGTATITATAGTLSASAAVTVTRASLTVEPTELVFTSIGASQRITAVVRDGTGAVVTNPVIAYLSADPAIATVDATGNVTARAVGSTSVTVSFEGDVRTVTVVVRQEPARLVVTPTEVTLEVAETSSLEVTVFDAADQPIAVSPEFSSSNPEVATVSATGVITGVAVGTARIAVVVGSRSDTVSVNVVEDDGALPDLRFESITLQPGTTLTVGSASLLTVRIRSDGAGVPAFSGQVRVYDESGEIIVYQTIIEHPAIEADGFVDLQQYVLPTEDWPQAVVVVFTLDHLNQIAESNEENNLRIFPGGENLLLVERPGTPTLTITPASAHIGLVGGTQQLTATVLDGSGNPVEVAVTWVSANPDVASVDPTGLVTGNSAGFTSVIASAVVGGAVRADTVSVAVGAAIPEGVTTIWLGPPTGTGYADWNTPGYWSTGVVPGPDDVVLIPDCYAYSRSTCVYPQLSTPVVIAGLRTGLDGSVCAECTGAIAGGRHPTPGRRPKGALTDAGLELVPPSRNDVVLRRPAAAGMQAQEVIYHVELNGSELRVNGIMPDYTYIGGPSESLLVLGGSEGTASPVQAQVYNDVSIVGAVGLYNSYIQGDLTITGQADAYAWTGGSVTVAAGGILRPIYSFSMDGQLQVNGQVLLENGSLYSYADVHVNGPDGRIDANSAYLWVNGRLYVDGGTIALAGYGGMEAYGGLSLDGATAMLEMDASWAEVGVLNPDVPPALPALLVQNGARFSMTHEDAYFDVRGDASIDGGSTDGLLTAGEIYFYGNFTVGAAPFAYAPSGEHESAFGYVNDVTHVISFANSGIGEGGSHFHHLETGHYSGLEFDVPIFVTGNAEMYNFTRGVDGPEMTILGTLNLRNPDFWYVQHTILYGAIYLQDAEAVPMDITLRGSQNLPYGFGTEGTLVIEGADVVVRNDYDMGVEGDVVVRAGARLETGYDSYTNIWGSILTMDGGVISMGDLSFLSVLGDAAFDGGTNDFSAGVLDVRGNLHAAPGTFGASGTHETRLTGGDVQVLDVVDAFQNLTFDNSDGGIQLVTDVTVNGLFEASGSSAHGTGLRYIRARDASVAGFTVNRVWLDFGNLTDATTVDVANLTFDGFMAGDAPPAQLRIALPGIHDLARTGFEFDPVASGPFIVVDGADVTYRFDSAFPASPGAERFGGAGSIYYNGVGVHNPSNAPLQLGPADQSTFHHWQRYVQMSWQPVDGAVSYELERETCYSGTMTDCTTWGADLVVSQAGTTFTHNHIGDQPGRWRVRAVFDGGEPGRYSPYRTFDFITYFGINEQSPTIVSGSTFQLTASIGDASQVPGLTWSSDNTAVATVNSSGLVTAIAAGTVVIRATSTSNPAVYSTTFITVLAGGTIVTGVDRGAAPVLTAPPGAVRRR